MFIEAKYVKNEEDVVHAISAIDENGKQWFFRISNNNSDYRTLMELVDAGKLTIEDAE